MLRASIAVLTTSVCAAILVVSSGIANAADGVFCENPSNPLSCTLVASTPGSDGTSGDGSSGDGAGGIKFNDGSGSAAEYNAANATAGAAEGSSDDSGGAGSSKPLPSTECDWTQ